MDDDSRDRLLARLVLACTVRAAHDLNAYDDQQRRKLALLVYLSGDEVASAAADQVLRALDVEPGQPSSELAAVIVVCRHDALVPELRRAGYEISDAEDPGPGRVVAIFLVARTCGRRILDLAEVTTEADDMLRMEIEHLPPQVRGALEMASREAVAIRDAERRNRLAIVVCDCDDPLAVDVGRALAAAAEKTFAVRPGYAVSCIGDHDMIGNVARGLGYTIPEVRRPSTGWMDAFVFAEGRVLLTQMKIEDDEKVVREERREGTAAAEYAKRAVRERQVVVMKALRLLESQPGLLALKIIVIFGSRTALALGVYRDLATLPEQYAFPPELPANASVISVTYEDFMRSVRARIGDMEDIEAEALGPGQARFAVFTPTGVYIDILEPLPGARGALA